MLHDVILKLFGLIPIVAVCLLVVRVLRRQPSQKHRSFSEHAALSKWSYIRFAITLTVGGGLFYVFLLFWLAPSLRLPATFYVVVIVGYVMQIITAWVPATAGLSKGIHAIAAYAMAVLMAVVSVIVLFYGETPVPVFVQSIGVIFLIYAVVAFGLLFTSKRARKYYLFFQLTYVALFFLFVTTIIFSI